MFCVYILHTIMPEARWGLPPTRAAEKSAALFYTDRPIEAPGPKSRIEENPKTHYNGTDRQTAWSICCTHNADSRQLPAALPRSVSLDLGCPGDIFPAKWPDSAGDCVPYQPIWAAEAGLLAAGPSAGPQICDTGFDLWIKRHPLHHRRGCSVPICDNELI